MPPHHAAPAGGCRCLARLIVDVIAPEVLVALLFYGYATGRFSSRQIEKATYESLPSRYCGGRLPPDHDPLASFRKTFRPELKDLFAGTWGAGTGVQILLLAQAAEGLTVGNLSLAGTKIYAEASKSRAVSYKRLLELEHQLQTEVDELFALNARAEPLEVQAGLVIPHEIALRQQRLAQLAAAQSVLEARARPGTKPNKLNRKPQCGRGETGHAGRSASPAGAPPSLRRLDRRMRISTISLLGFRHASRPRVGWLRLPASGVGCAWPST